MNINLVSILINLKFAKVKKGAESVRVAFRCGKQIPLVYIHGSGFDGSVWLRQLEEVGGYAIDLPCHGLSDKAIINTVEDYAFYVAKATEKLIGKAFFAGHSLGGAIAQTLYLNFRSIVNGLILIGTGARLRVLPQILDELRSKPEEAINIFINYSFGMGIELRSLIEETKKLLLERKEILLKDLLICDKFDLLEDLKSEKIKVNVPTLIIVGEKDRLTPVKYSQFFHSIITSSKLYIIKEAGHMVMIEKPEEFNKILSEFITHSFH